MQNFQNFIITRSVLILQLMSQYDSLEQLDLDRYKLNYFSLDGQEDYNKKAQKGTGIIDQAFDLPNSPYSEIENYGENHRNAYESIQGFPQSKKIIQVGKKFRTNYMKAKKGDNEETNDLSINVCTLIKSFCTQYQIFEKVEEEEVQQIKEFKKSKSNINSLKKLMQQNRNEMKCQFSENRCQKRREKSRMAKFFCRQLEKPETLVEILKSRKMKFCNKIIILKYLQTIKKSAENPELFKGWKKNSL